jgi:hypothetical protein
LFCNCFASAPVLHLHLLCICSAAFLHIFFTRFACAMIFGPALVLHLHLFYRFSASVMHFQSLHRRWGPCFRNTVPSNKQWYILKGFLRETWGSEVRYEKASLLS